MGEYHNVHVDVEDRIAVLTIDHPPVNAIDKATFNDLKAAFEQALADEAVKVIILTGAGTSFVAGADIHELDAIANVEEAREFVEAGQAFFSRIERSPKPVIAAINGRFCLGGGNELALACHMRIAEEKTKLGQPEITLGLIPGWGATQRLVQQVGLGKAVELILTGRPIRAAEAFRIGLVNEVVAEGEALDAAKRLAKRLTALSSVALTKALDAIYTGLEVGYKAGLAHEIERFSEMAATEDMHEGLRAFLEKRKANYQE
jgi:enoyl-CoA hydratase/carnithine racemase